MIRLDHADKYYNRGNTNELHVMNDISLELPERGMVAVFGQSGCGKTTLLNAIGGLDKLTSGTISVFDNNIAKHTDDLRNQYIGYIFQNYNLSKNETVFENVANALQLCGMSDDAEIKTRVMAALTNVGMEKFCNRQPDTLSGGQQQRVAIARALVKNPAIILADEPTGNLDEANTVLIMDILKQVSGEHLVVLVTHEANLVDYYCDRVIRIVDGKISSVRDNENTTGYSGRGKNDIYLGELTLQESTVPGVKIEYYGEMQEEIRLRLVSVDGKLYLKNDSSNVKILDESSEIKLHPGVFETPDEAVPAQKIDMSALTPVQGKNYGKLFSFQSAVASGYRENFSKGGKKSRKLLRLSMVLLAFVVVFMSAGFAVGLKDISDLKKNHNDNILFLPLTQELDTTPISGYLGENGIDYARVIGGSYVGSAENIPFRVGNFITASIEDVSASGNVLDEKLSEDLPLVCGVRTFEKPLDVIITTALADEMIEKCGASFIKDYSDLLHMISKQTYDGKNYMRITGVVESTEKNFYLQSMYATYVILQNVYGGQLPVTPASFDSVHTSEIAPGNVAVLTNETTLTAGNRVTIMGEDYLVSEVIRTYAGNTQYKDFVKDTYGVKLQTAEEYFQRRLAQNPEADYTATALDWFFNYYAQYYQAFCARCVTLEIEPWLYLNGGKTEHLIAALAAQGDVTFTDKELYAAYLYRQANGAYPTDTQLQKYLSANGDATMNDYSNTINNDQNMSWAAYDQYSWQHSGSATGFVMADADYMRLSTVTGVNDRHVCESNLFETWESWDESDGLNYAHYMLIHTTDPVAAQQYLQSVYGDTLLTSEKIFDAEMSAQRSSIVTNLISLAIVLVLICLCIFFIMRSSLMSAVKEIGIYRAIGVSKKNLTFRFMVESLVLSTLSLTVGYVVAAAVVMKLATYTGMFYFPLWLAVGLLLLLYAVTVIFGTLPVRLLLRKTPSEILAKYDI